MKEGKGTKEGSKGGMMERRKEGNQFLTLPIYKFEIKKTGNKNCTNVLRRIDRRKLK